MLEYSVFGKDKQAIFLVKLTNIYILRWFNIGVIAQNSGDNVLINGNRCCRWTSARSPPVLPQGWSDHVCVEPARPRPLSWPSWTATVRSTLIGCSRWSRESRRYRELAAVSPLCPLTLTLQCLCYRSAGMQCGDVALLNNGSLFCWDLGQATAVLMFRGSIRLQGVIKWDWTRENSSLRCLFFVLDLKELR